MPSGYTASALLSVWPTNSSSQFVIGLQQGKQISIAIQVALNTTTGQASYTSLSISGIVPKNAKSCSGYLYMGGSSSSQIALNVASTSAGIGQQSLSNTEATSTIGMQTPYGNLLIATAQTIYWESAITGTILGIEIIISSYSI